MTSSDNPAQLALNFAKVHNLDLPTQKELEAQLHLQKLTAFSPKQQATALAAVVQEENAER